MEAPADVELPVHGARAGGVGSQREQGRGHGGPLSPEVPVWVVDLHRVQALSDLALVPADAADPTCGGGHTSE